MPELLLLHNGKEVRRVVLGDAPLSIGRAPGNDLIVDDARVSREHARVVRAGETWRYEDLDSTHGSLLLGKKISSRDLEDGDRFEIGGHSLVFAVDTAVAAAPAAAPVDDVRLRALFEMSRLLEGETDFDAALGKLMQKAIAIMGAERGFLMLAGEDGALQVRVALDAKGPIAPEEASNISRTIVDRVRETGQPILLENALTDRDFGSQSVVLNSIHSVLCAPLKTQDTVSGVLYVDHRERPRAFSQDDLAFFTTLALQAKSAIDNSLAYWELVESLFRASDDLIVVVDPRGRVVRASAPTEAAEFAQLFVAEDRAAAAAMLKQTLQSAAPENVELRLAGRRRAGTPLSVASFALRDRQGRVTGACFIGRDLSEMRDLIARLEEANVKLKELNDAKSEFVGMVSHEMKSPLSVILGFADLLLLDEKEPLSGEQRGTLKKVVRRAEGMNEMIGSLLDLTKIETGKIELTLEDVDVAAAVREALDDQSLRAQEKNVTLRADLPEGATTVRADRVLLRRVIENFVTNGIKYNVKGGSLTVGLEMRAEEYTLRFADTGYGLSPEDQERLFGRFFRADAHRDIEGTGLGLSVVKAVVERHGGSIQVESALGEGTTFTVDLPQTPPTP